MKIHIKKCRCRILPATKHETDIFCKITCDYCKSEFEVFEINAEKLGKREKNG